MTEAEVIRAAMKLTPAERDRVADVLFEVGEGDQEHVDKAWKSEVRGRIEKIQSGQTQGLTSEEVKVFLAERRASRRA